MKMRPMRERLWVALRENRHRWLDLKMLGDKASVWDYEHARPYVEGWVKAGIVESRIDPEYQNQAPRKRRQYKLVRDMGVDAPRVTSTGRPIAWGVRQANMWRTMRMLKRFDYHEVAAHASTREHDIAVLTAKEYVNKLARAGYLREIAAPVAHRKGGKPTVWFLAKDTGPRAPVVERLDTVYDPNLNKVMWQMEAGNE